MDLGSKRLGWTQWVPLVHLVVCLGAASGYVLRPLQPLGILSTFLVIADFPISFIYVILALGNYAVLAYLFLLVGGTGWWYFLCYEAQSIHSRLKNKKLFKRNC